jgi:hypothetical protein
MSELRADTITASDGTSPVTLTKQAAAKAFVSYTSTTSHTIRSSLNTSSITDNGTGDTTINFSSNFDSTTAHCCADVHGTQSSGFPSAAYFDGATFIHGQSYTTSSVRQGTGYRNSGTSGFSDDDRVGLIIHGDLA